MCNQMLSVLCVIKCCLYYVPSNVAIPPPRRPHLYSPEARGSAGLAMHPVCSLGQSQPALGSRDPDRPMAARAHPLLQSDSVMLCGAIRHFMLQILVLSALYTAEVCSPRGLFLCLSILGIESGQPPRASLSLPEPTRVY